MLRFAPNLIAQRAEEEGQLGNFNPYPSIVYAGACGTWIVYALGMRNIYIMVVVSRLSPSGNGKV
jgi:hypothetical protein